MKPVFKSYDGKRWSYYYDGVCFRCCKREFKYACIATYGERSKVVSLGNNRVSTYRSMAHCFSHCDLDVVSILNFVLSCEECEWFHVNDPEYPDNCEYPDCPPCLEILNTVAK